MEFNAPAQRQAAEGPTRGFTTLQLLQLAVIANKNKMAALGQVPVSKVSGKPSNLQGGKAVYENLRTQIGGLPAPPGKSAVKGVRAKQITPNVIKSMGPKGTGWFNGGQGLDAYERRPGTPGDQIEAQRQNIYNWLGQNQQYLLNADAYVLPVGVGTLHADNGGALAKALKSSYEFGVPKAAKGRTKESLTRAGWSLRGGPGVGPDGKPLKSFIQAVIAVYRRGSGPPGAVVKSGRAGAVASAQDALDIIAGTRGFLNQKLADYLASRFNLKGNPSAAQAQALAQFNDAVENTASTMAQQNNAIANWNAAGSGASKRQAIQALGTNPRKLATLLTGVMQAVGGFARLADILWLIGTKSQIIEVMRGYDIHTPDIGANEKRSFQWLASTTLGGAEAFPADGSNPNDANGGAVAYTRFVFNALLQQYLTADANGVPTGAGGDLLSERGEKRKITAAKNAGARGIAGPTDKSIVALQAPAGKAPEALAVALFVRKARQNKYSMEALQAGARLIGLQGQENALIHNAVIYSIVDYIVRTWGVPAQAGDLGSIVAVGAALGLQNMTWDDVKVASPAALEEAKAKIIRKVDAMYGILTAPCRNVDGKVVAPDGLIDEDLKRVGAAHSVLQSKLKNASDACGALSQYVQAPSQTISSKRREQTRNAPTAATEAPGNLANIAGGGAAPAALGGLNFSPRQFASLQGGAPRQTGNLMPTVNNNNNLPVLPGSGTRHSLGGNPPVNGPGGQPLSTGRGGRPGSQHTPMAPAPTRGAGFSQGGSQGGDVF